MKTHQGAWHTISTVALAAAFACALPLLPTSCALAQEQETPSFSPGNARMVRGTVTAVAPDHLTVKTEVGDTFQVALTPNTRLTKGRDPIKATDIHPGDGIGAMGEVDTPNHTVHAAFVTIVDAEQLKKAREAMGKTYIAGKITAIDADNLKITLLRADGVTQTIQVDESTSFRKVARGAGGFNFNGNGGAPATPPPAGESITLADFKVGDQVAGPGALKNGVFIPTQLAQLPPGGQGQGGGRRRRPQGAGSDTNGTTPPPAPTEPR